MRLVFALHRDSTHYLLGKASSQGLGKPMPRTACQILLATLCLGLQMRLCLPVKLRSFYKNRRGCGLCHGHQVQEVDVGWPHFLCCPCSGHGNKHSNPASCVCVDTTVWYCVGFNLKSLWKVSIPRPLSAPLLLLVGCWGHAEGWPVSWGDPCAQPPAAAPGEKVVHIVLACLGRGASCSLPASCLLFFLHRIYVAGAHPQCSL